VRVRFTQTVGKQAALFFFTLPVCAAFPCASLGWGGSGSKLVVNRAIDTLPLEIRGFFESNRSFLTQHVTDPLNNLAAEPTRRRNSHLFLDKYGRFPFEALPRSYKAAVAKYGRSKIESNGLLPWQIGVYSQKLTESMRQGQWEEAKQDAAILAYYVGEAHDPFNTTENFDGHLSGQKGINERFGSTLIERFSSFFPMRPGDASFIADPTDHAFEACLTAHSSVERILLADRNARQKETSYTDDYFERFYGLSAETLIRQLSDAARDIGSYWVTAWSNAGKPQPPR